MKQLKFDFMKDYDLEYEDVLDYYGENLTLQEWEEYIGDYEGSLPDYILYDNSLNTNIPDNCKYCTNHPSNGGSGICHCILGNNITFV